MELLPLKKIKFFAVRVARTAFSFVDFRSKKGGGKAWTVPAEAVDPTGRATEKSAGAVRPAFPVPGFKLTDS